MVGLILYPSSLFLNRGIYFLFYFNEIYYININKGNHEDIMVTVRYGFQNEVNQKYGVSCLFFLK